jgi:hypothetical protein
MVLDPNRKPMPPEKWERVKAQVRENARLIRERWAKKRLQEQQPADRPTRSPRSWAAVGPHGS